MKPPVLTVEQQSRLLEIEQELDLLKAAPTRDFKKQMALQIEHQKIRLPLLGVLKPTPMPNTPKEVLDQHQELVEVKAILLNVFQGLRCLELRTEKQEDIVNDMSRRIHAAIYYEYE